MFLIIVLNGYYFLKILPDRMSLFASELLLIFAMFPHSTVITLKNVNNSAQRVSNFSQNFWKCPHNTIIPLRIIKIFWNFPHITLIS